MQDLWGSQYPSSLAELTQQPVSNTQRREIQRPRTVLFTGDGPLHLETSKFSYTFWQCTMCSNKSPSIAASLNRALTRKAHEELNPDKMCWRAKEAPNHPPYSTTEAAEVTERCRCLNQALQIKGKRWL